MSGLPKSPRARRLPIVCFSLFAVFSLAIGTCVLLRGLPESVARLEGRNGFIYSCGTEEATLTLHVKLLSGEIVLVRGRHVGVAFFEAGSYVRVNRPMKFDACPRKQKMDALLAHHVLRLRFSKEKLILSAVQV